VDNVLTSVVHPALKELGLPLSPDTVLFGHDGKLDSIGLLRLVLIIEGNFRAQGRVVRLVSDKAFSQSVSPFRTAAALEAYIQTLLNEAPNA
jgi:acyl carrier protein